eukprot:TRINITY_DN67790_c0_g12_i1.p1 TRINITY_DN67790_c0_g12~~TRINITY_DN67790_c0_g12_i1.p1  ORF type:complete len:359 (-),score=28.76 TRINITY_DN67790_c0_g12_i1:141-1217(-)
MALSPNGWKEHQFENIVVITGAGISVASGIPDFRSSTGVYACSQSSSSTTKETLFDLESFTEDPLPLFELLQSVFFDKETERQPTPVHAFVKLLSDKGLLLRNYTQNIDNLEDAAGVPTDTVVHCHGTLASATCMRCDHTYQSSFVREELKSGKGVARCNQQRSTDTSATHAPATGAPQFLWNNRCNGIVKPDIVLFGEDLPGQWGKHLAEDLTKCDLLVVLGTSLAVEPVQSLVTQVNNKCTRIVVNNDTEVLQNIKEHMTEYQEPSDSDLDWFVCGDCHTIVEELVKLAGWQDEFKQVKEKIGTVEHVPPAQQPISAGVEAAAAALVGHLLRTETALTPDQDPEETEHGPKRQKTA